MKKVTPRLGLSRETVRELDPDELRAAEGAATFPTTTVLSLHVSACPCFSTAGCGSC